MPRSSRSEAIKKRKKLQPRSAGCKAFCCGCRLSVSSSEEPESSNNSGRFPTVSSIAHAMVQERLDQMIREKREARNDQDRMRREARREEKKFVIMMAMEKSSCNPREDFRESMKQIIVANRIHEAKDLRRLLSCYVTMNPEEFRGVILEVSWIGQFTGSDIKMIKDKSTAKYPPNQKFFSLESMVMTCKHEENHVNGRRRDVRRSHSDA